MDLLARFLQARIFTEGELNDTRISDVLFTAACPDYPSIIEAAITAYLAGPLWLFCGVELKTTSSGLD